MEEESKVKKTIRYSKAFKRPVVDEIARGKFSSPQQANASEPCILNPETQLSSFFLASVAGLVSIARIHLFESNL